MAKRHYGALSIEVEGVKELTKKLQEVNKNLADEETEKALRKGAKPMKDTAERKAPWKTGKLSTNMLVKSEKMGVNTQVRIGPNYRKTAVGHLAEFGTKPRQHKSGHKTGKMPASPFMRPAYDENKDKSLEIIAKELKRALKRAAKGR